MSIEAMKQALEALVSSTGELRLRLASPTDAQLIKNDRAITTLRQAIAEAEKQEGWVLREVYFEDGEPISYREPQWVGLTDEELHDAFNFVEFIKQISFDRDRPEWCENFAAYIEAKLREKNA